MARIRTLPTLDRRGHPLSSSGFQRAALDALPLAHAFHDAAAEAAGGPLRAANVEVLQINVGKRCNQSCRHCHVDAGPDRAEVMPRAVLEACLQVLERSRIPTVDVTGGAPELHPAFRKIVTRARALGRHVMDRCNLTVMRLACNADLPGFFAEHGVEVIASLPWYARRRTDAQRGEGVFEASIEALRALNRVGYGHEGSGLLLQLVTNPAGAFLPANQSALERDWKRELGRRYGVYFNRLYTITNMPISRFLEWLLESDNLEGYMARLVAAFNPAAVSGLMCRSTLSVGWDGSLYDCDFNQMLELPIGSSIFDLAAGRADLAGRAIRVGPHCFGCTAGAGSSCGGATAAA